MLFRCRLYIVIPGKTEAFNSFFRSHLFPLQQRYGATLIGRWQTDDGGRILALWAYRDRADYETIQAQVRADPDASYNREYRDATLGSLYTECDEFFLDSTVPLEETALAHLAPDMLNHSHTKEGDSSLIRSSVKRKDSGIEITEAIPSEKPLLRQLLELYLYDFSEFEDAEIGPHGFFGYSYLDHYWTDPDRHPYLIRVNNHLTGFMLVNRHGFSGEDRWAVAEFFVMRKYRKRGVGEYSATAVFDLWPGKWEVNQISSHPGSTAFWRKVIGRYTNGQFEERKVGAEANIGPTQFFDNTDYAREEERTHYEG